jgi:hypothetical protein
MNIQRSIVIVLGLILVFVAAQAIVPKAYTPQPREITEEGQCIGEPIEVDFAYNGGVNEPWTCQVQCDDDEPRYILYSNGMATQCETPPGCNDTGEDTGVTCTPPAA